VTVVWVALGALAGAPLRLLADRLAVARRGPGSVLGTLVVNVVRLVEERAVARAVAYLAASLVLGIGTAATGYALSR
jgi:CrcB protein